MSQEVVIQIRLTLPDGASYRVLAAPEPEPESVLTEPLPPEPGNEYATPVIGYTAPDTSARRGIAIQPGAIWAAGQVHLAGHKPLKAGAKGGLYCSTLLSTNPDGTKVWCPFRA